MERTNTLAYFTLRRQQQNVLYRCHEVQKELKELLEREEAAKIAKAVDSYINYGSKNVDKSLELSLNLAPGNKANGAAATPATPGTTGSNPTKTPKQKKDREKSTKSKSSGVNCNQTFSWWPKSWGQYYKLFTALIIPLAAYFSMILTKIGR